jgi:hypothetical protein
MAIWIDVDFESEVWKELREQRLEDGRHVLDTDDNGVSLYVDVVDGVARGHGLHDGEGNDVEDVITMTGRKIIIDDPKPEMTICVACYKTEDGRYRCVWYPCPLIL